MRSYKKLEGSRNIAIEALSKFSTRSDKTGHLNHDFKGCLPPEYSRCSGRFNFLSGARCGYAHDCARFQALLHLDGSCGIKVYREIDVFMAVEGCKHQITLEMFNEIKKGEAGMQKVEDGMLRYNVDGEGCETCIGCRDCRNWKREIKVGDRLCCGEFYANKDQAEGLLEYYNYFRGRRSGPGPNKGKEMSEEQTKYDPKARYYNKGGIETLDVIKAKLAVEQYKGFCLGNAMKYICRADHKGNYNRDIEKAIFYLKQAQDGGEA